MTSRDSAEILDAALAGETTDQSVAPLTELADGLRTSFATPAPPAPGARALFVQGVVARKPQRRGPRMLVPSVALGVLALVVAVLSRTALPGSALYQVRKVLASVDLAPTAQHEVDARIARSRDELALAESLLPGKPGPALASANVALEQLGQARSFLDDVGNGDRSKDLAVIAALEERADSVIAQAHAAMQSHSPSGSSPTASTNDSGAGSDDSGGDESSHSEGQGSSESRGNDSGHGSNSRSGSNGGDGSSHGDSSGDASGSHDQGQGSESSGSRDGGHDSGSSKSGDRSGGSGSDDQQGGSGDSTSGGSDGSNHGNGPDSNSDNSNGVSGGSGSDADGLGGTSKGGGSSGGSSSDDGAPSED